MAPTYEPIRKRIIDDIEDALEAIVAGDDYYYTDEVAVNDNYLMFYGELTVNFGLPAE